MRYPILLVSFALLIIATTLTTAQEGPGGLPVYPGSTQVQLSQAELESMVGGIPSGVSTAAYTTTASCSEVINWYEENMSGWVLREKNLEEYFGSLSYVNENTGREARIAVRDNQGYNRLLVLAEGPAGAFGGGYLAGGSPMLVGVGILATVVMVTIAAFATRKRAH